MSEPLFSAAEARRLLSLGLPVFVAQLSQTGMTFVDTAMTGQYATADMAAVAVAGSIWAPLSLLGVGCLLALSPMSAHLVGGGERGEAAHLLRQGIWLTCILAAVLMVLFQIISYNIDVFGLEPQLADLAGGYLRAMLWGLPGFMLFVNVRSFLEGFSRTRPAMVIGLLGLALNVPCNYGFIYGVWGLPRLGAAVVDGTAPHVVEPRCPGAVERYVNLGDCYDAAALRPLRAGISLLPFFSLWAGGSHRALYALRALLAAFARRAYHSSQIHFAHAVVSSTV